MFSEIVNYFVIPTLISASAFGAYYILRPDEGKKLASRVAWYGINMYSRAAIYFENLTEPEPIVVDGDDFDEVESLSYYNSEKQIVISVGTDYKTLPDEWWKNNDINADLLMLKKSSGEQYKIFHTHADLIASDTWTSVEKPFVQVELEQDGKIIDIHKNLDQFYIAGSRILSKTFLEWYLKVWYDMELNDVYTLKIFDKDVNLFSIGPESHILLDESYSVINSDSQDVNEGTTDEGATDE